MKTTLLKVLTISLSTLVSCAPFRDSPYSDNLLRPERNLNQKAHERLADVEADGKIRIAFLTDSHQDYEKLDEAIYQINQTEDLDFVVHLGDFTNSAYNFEFDQFLDSYVTIKKPTFVAMGNHDLISSGASLYKKVFGQHNFYFESASKRFIVFNSNNLEYPEGFDPNWLLSTVSSSSKPVVIFSHVQLREPARFFGSDAQILGDVIGNAKTQLILNGDNHIYSLTDDQGTAMLQCPRTKAGWVLIEIQANQLNVIRKDTGESVWVTLKN